MQAKIKEWLNRYLPAELLSTAAAMIAGMVTYNVAHSYVLTALIATWPLLMYYLPILTGSLFTGLILAKFTADINFYVPTTLSYEIAKKHFRNFIL